MLAIQIDPDALQPFVETIIESVVKRLEKPETISIDAKQAAKRYNVSTDLINQARKDGKIRGFKCGKKYLYRTIELDKLEAWLD